MAFNGISPMNTLAKIIEFRNVDYSYDSLIRDQISIFDQFYVGRKQLKQNTRIPFKLSNFNFELRRGDVLGVIGSSGSGKSTFLKLCSRILVPTSGEVLLNGRVSPMIELGVGFSMDFSAQENALLYACLIGNNFFSVKEQLTSIIDWAELSGREREPLRQFSTGMVARLAFATATEFPTDLLIIDEVLSVGDEHFRKKSTNRLNRLIQDSSAVILVSHDLATIEELCTRVIYLSEGTIVYDGDVKTAISHYRKSQNT
jgi:ABC-type polysaccharide/polyol phosphate transport system ATPase subunit